MKNLILVGSLAAASFGLAACGPRLPVRVTLVNCVDQKPINGAQVDRLGNITRTDAEGHWDGEQMGEGALSVEVLKEGYAKQKFQWKPGEERQVVCLTPDE